jgi:hypothetical protein
MAFLFRGKKDADKTQDTKDSPRSVTRSPISPQSSNGRINGKQAIPGSSIENPKILLQGRAQNRLVSYNPLNSIRTMGKDLLFAEN